MGVYSEGTATSTLRIGSSSTGPHCGMPSRMASAPAVLKASSELSTLWKEPSVRVTDTSTTGWPSGPLRRYSRTPASTAGMYCLGMAPPTIMLAKVMPEPRGSGLISMWTSPNWPWPPVWRLKRPCWETGLRIASL